MVKSFALRVAKYAGLFALSSWFTRNRVRVLGYHGIWFLPGHFGNFLFMSAEKFQSRMTWLKKSKYAVITLDQAVNDLGNGKTEPYSTVITIDDGWDGTYRFMLPCLEDVSLPATLYVYTGHVDSQMPIPNVLIQALIHLSDKESFRLDPRYSDKEETFSLRGPSSKARTASRVLEILEKLEESEKSIFCQSIAEALGVDYDALIETRQFHLMRYEQISDAESRGLDIQLHTHTHQLSTENPEKLQEEIRINREKLAPHVRSSLDHFCYPSGVHCEEMYEYLTNSDIKSATLVEAGLATAGTSPFAIKRILDGEDVAQIEFEAELSGFLDIVRQCKAVMRG